MGLKPVDILLTCHLVVPTVLGPDEVVLLKRVTPEGPVEVRPIVLEPEGLDRVVIPEVDVIDRVVDDPDYLTVLDQVDLCVLSLGTPHAPDVDHVPLCKVGVEDLGVEILDVVLGVNHLWAS